MRRLIYLAGELLCVAALAGFIVLLALNAPGGTQKTVSEIASPVEALLADSGMEKKSAQEAAKEIGFDSSAAEGIFFCENDDVMDVSEILIVKLSGDNDGSAVKTAIEKRLAEQKALYKNYAPDQYALLCDAIVAVDGNTVFYCVSKDAQTLYRAFRDAL